jgi:hypothetical protein
MATQQRVKVRRTICRKTDSVCSISDPGVIHPPIAEDGAKKGRQVAEERLSAVQEEGQELIGDSFALFYRFP